MALTFAYLPASKHMHVFENTQTYIRVDKKLSEAPNTHREGFILGDLNKFIKDLKTFQIIYSGYCFNLFCNMFGP